MNAKIGWLLALAVVAMATQLYGVQGLLAAASLVVFWLLLQWTRAMRVMRRVAKRPVGHVPSAVMLNAKLKRGMPLLDVIARATSLGSKLDDSGDAWEWRDAGGSAVRTRFDGGRLVWWSLERPTGEAQAPGPQTPAA